MKLSELILLADWPKSDPEILFLHDWGELVPAKVLQLDDLVDDDPALDAIIAAGGAIILEADSAIEL